MKEKCEDLLQEIQDAHNQLDLIGAPRKNEEGYDLSITGRIQYDPNRQAAQKLEDAHNELDLINVPRKGLGGQVLTVAGRLQLLRASAKDLTFEPKFNYDFYYGVKKYMKSIYKDYLDSANCLLLTPLVETVAEHFSTDHWLDNSEHWIWDLAVIVQEELEKEDLINK